MSRHNNPTFVGGALLIATLAGCGSAPSPIADRAPAGRVSATSHMNPVAVKAGKEVAPAISHFSANGKILGPKVSVLQGFGATFEADVTNPGTAKLTYTWTLDGEFLGIHEYNWYPYLPSQHGTFVLACTLGTRAGEVLSRKEVTIVVRPL